MLKMKKILENSVIKDKFYEKINKRQLNLKLLLPKQVVQGLFIIFLIHFSCNFQQKLIHNQLVSTFNVSI